ncbi:unnamed protein product [Peniophora sp. CBMAI 1063]|nr:unnamed protein product [Peniophora sp. CBMAI 1063]
MLNNPDLKATAVINRWIIAILLFHFRLQHVPGASHAVDGTLRRCHYDGDLPEFHLPDYDNWIDNVYEFMHIINDAFCRRDSPALPPVQHAFSQSDQEPSSAASPVSIPHLEHTLAGDGCLLRVRFYLLTLKRPDDLSDSAFSQFLGYVWQFFVLDN